MTQFYILGVIILMACALEVFTLPNQNRTNSPEEDTTESATETERSLTYDKTNPETQESSIEILEKIKAINDALQRPNRRPPFKWNTQQTTTPPPSYVLDQDILQKLQQVIASGKIHSYSNNFNTQVSNSLYEDPNIRFSRQLASLYPGNLPQVNVAASPYLTNIPVLVVPSSVIGNSNTMDSLTKYQAMNRQTPSFLPTIPWPLAPFFPVLIKDPLLHMMSGGSWNTLFDVGQSADVCNRKQKSDDPNYELTSQNYKDILKLAAKEIRSRKKRAVKKRTVAQGTQLQDLDAANKIVSFFTKKPTTTTAKPIVNQDIKTLADEHGDPRFPFLDLFSHKNRKPTGPSFYINKLKVRKGGVAIAGPGGVATAGRGGTAIVGPGGLAYTQPGGIAVAGPSARVIALTSDADLSSIVSRLQAQARMDNSVPHLIQAIPEGRVVATGPIIYFHPNNR